MEKTSSTSCYLGEGVCREWHLNAHSAVVLTCEGSIGEKGFRKKLEGMVSAMCRMLKIGGDDVSLKMVEPWNSVRVTFTIPRDAAQRLRQLAQGNPQQLRELGILSVQIEGEGVVRLAPVQTQHLDNRSSAAAASAATASSLPNPAAPAGRGMQSVPAAPDPSRARMLGIINQSETSQSANLSSTGSRPPGHQPAPVMWSRMPGQSYSHMQQGSMQQGSMQQGSMQQGSMQQGSMQQSSMQQGSMQQGSMQQSSMQQGSMQQSSMQQGSMQQGSMQQGSMQQGSMQQGSMQQGSMQQGSMQQGSMQQSSMQQSSMQQSSMQQSSMQQGSMQQGSMQQSSMQQGSMQQGSMQQSSMQQGSMQQGSMQQGSMQQGSMQQSSMQQGSMQQGSMQQGSMQQGSMQQGSMQQGSMGMAMQTFQNNAQVPSQFHRPMMTPSTAPPHPPPPYPFGSQQVSAGVQSHFMMAHSSSAPKMSPMLQNKPSGNALPPTSQASLQQGPPPGHMTHYPPVMSSPIQPQRRLEQPGVRNRLPFGMSAVQSNPGGPAPNHESMAPVPTTSQMENRGHMQSTHYHMAQNAVKFEAHHAAQGAMQASVGEVAGAAPAALGHAQQESQAASRGNKPVPFHGSPAVSTIKDQRSMNAADMREAAKESMKQNAAMPRVAHVGPTKHEGEGRGPTGSQQTLGNVGNVPRGAMGAQQDKGPPTPRVQAKATVTQLEMGSCQPGQVASAGSQREAGPYARRAAASGGGQQDGRNASWGPLGNQSSSEMNAAGSGQVVASGNQQDAGNALHRQSDAQFDGASQSQVAVSCNPVGTQREEHPPNTMAKTEVQLVTTTKSQMVALQNQVPGAQGQVMNVTSHIRAVTSASESVPESSAGTVEKSSSTGHGNVRKSPCAALTQQLITGVGHGNQTAEFQGRGQGASAGSASEQAEGQEQGGRGPRVRSAGTSGSDACPPGAPLEPALVGERASPTSGGVVVGRFPAPALPYGFSAGAMNPTSAAAAAAAATRAQAAASLANKDVTLTSPLLVNLLQSDITSSQFAHGNKQGANGANRKKPVRNQKKKNPPGRQDKVQSSSDGDALLDVQLQEKTKVEPSDEHENATQHGVSMQGASSKMNEQHQSDVQSSFQLTVQRDVADPTREVSEMTEHHLPQKQNAFDSYDPSSAALELATSGPPATSGHDLQPLKPQVAPTILNSVEIPRSLPLYGPSAMYSAGQNAPIGPNNAAVCEKGPQPLGADVAGSSSFSQEKSETIMPSIKEESCAMVENKPNNHFGRDDHSKARHLQTSPTACAGSAASPFSQGQSLPAANIKFGGSTRDLSQLASPGQIGQQGNTSVQILHGGTRIAFSSNTVPSQTPVSGSQHQALSAPLGTLQTSVSRPKTPNRASPRPYNAIPPSFCPPSTEPSEISLSPERLNASIAGLFPPQINVPLPPKQPCLNARTLEQQGLNPTTLKAIGQVPGNQSAFPQMPGGVSVKSEEPYQERQTSIGVKRSSPSSRKGTQCTVKKSIPSPNRKLSVTGTRRAGDSPGAQINKHSLQHSILTSAPDKNASFMNEPLVRNIYLPTLPNFKSSAPAAEPSVAEITPASIPPMAQMKSPSSLLPPGVGENILKHNLSYAPLPFTASTAPSPSLSSELENPAVASAHKPPLWPTTPSNYEECFAGNTAQPAMGFGTLESKSVDSVVPDDKNTTVILPNSGNASLQIHNKSPERNNGNGDALQLLNSEATNKHDAKISFREANEPTATTLMVNPTERPEEQSCSAPADGGVVDTHAKPLHVIPPEKRGAADTSSMKNDSSLSSPPSCAQDQMVSEKVDNVDIVCSSDTANPVSSEPPTSKSSSIPVIEPSNAGEREKELNSTNVKEAVVHSAVSKTEQPEQSTAPQDVTVKHEESDSNITSCDITSSISSESATSSVPVESPAAKSSMDVSPERKSAELPELDNKSYLESQSCHTSANDQQATSDASKVASSSVVSECSSSAESAIGSGNIHDAGAVPSCKKSHRAKTPFESGIGEQLESSEKDEPSAIAPAESQAQLVGPTDNTPVSTDVVTLEDHSSTSTSDDAATQSQSTDVGSSSMQEAAAGESAVDTAGDKGGPPMESELSAKTTVEVDKTSRNKQKEKDSEDSGVQQEMDVLQRKRSTRSASYCVARDVTATGSHAPSKRKKK